MRQARFSLALLLAAYAVTVAGCSDSIAPTQSDHDGDGWADADEVVRCQPSERLTATTTIGPAGGTIQVGAHRLVIPSGALSSAVSITATQLEGTLAQVEFQPHGLQFARPAQLTLNHEHCDVPDEYALDIVYIDNTDGIKILETLTSDDNDEDEDVDEEDRDDDDEDDKDDEEDEDDEDDGEEDDEYVVSNDNEVTANLQHFSNYAVAYRNGRRATAR